MEKGKLIVIDASNDRIGKTTVTNKLISALRKGGVSVYFKHYNDADALTGQYINYLLKRDSPVKVTDLDWKVVANLYLIDMKNSREEIKSLLDKGTWVVLDRYYTSTILMETAMYAKQQGIDINASTLEDRVKMISVALEIRELALKKYGLLKPDYIFLLYAPTIIKEFFNSVKAEADNFEGLEFQKELIKVFEALTKPGPVTLLDNIHPTKTSIISRLDEAGKIIESEEVVDFMLKTVLKDVK